MAKKKNPKKKTPVKLKAEVVGFDRKMMLKIFKGILFIAPFFYGLFYEFTACILGIALTVFLLVLLYKQRSIYFTGVTGTLMIAFFLCYLLSCFWAVDKGMAFVGFMKISPCIVFLFVLMQFTREEIRECYFAIPLLGAVMTVISLLGFVAPYFANWFIDGARLGGFFQYANAFALFLLIGVTIVGFKDERSPKNLCLFAVLLLGIFLSGSRTIFVLLVLILIVLALKTKQLRKPILAIGGLMIVVVLIYVFTTGDNTGIGRFTKLFSQSSELLGRLLYYKDGLSLLFKNPFGLGSLGYFYLQPQIQTGVYTTRYVHNMLLQIGLDAGFPAMLIFVAVLIKTLFSKTRSFPEKVMLAVICLHSLLDFDLEYLCILLILLMLLDFGSAKPYALSGAVQKAASGVLVLLSGLYAYFGMGFYLGHIGDYDTAIKMLPFDTELKTNAILEMPSEDEIIHLSSQILESNDAVALAYEGLMLEARQRQDFDEMVTYKRESIKRAKYDEKRYEEYLKILEEMMAYYNKRGDIERVYEYGNKALEVPGMLEEVLNQTDPLAYQLRDKPALALSEPAITYLEQLKTRLK